MKKRHLPISIIIIVLILILIIIFFFIYKDETKSNLVIPAKNMEYANAMTTNIWLEDKSLLDKFRENNVKYVFVDVGNTNYQGKITTNKEEISSFIDLINIYEKENNYDFTLLPYSEVILERNQFSKSFQNNYIDDYLSLMTLGFNGVYVDLEKIPKSDRSTYLDFLVNLRNSMPSNSVLAVYPGHIDTFPNSWEWSLSFMQEVSNRVDLISFGAYDTSTSDNDQYLNYMKNQIKKIQEENWNANFIYLAPTHKNSPETLSNSLKVFNEETKDNKGPFIGIGIFAEWTTDKSEWAVFSEN